MPAFSGSERWSNSAAYELIHDLRRQSDIGSIYKDPDTGAAAIDQVVFLMTSSLTPAAASSDHLGRESWVPRDMMAGIGVFSPVAQTTLMLGGATTILKQFFGFGDWFGIPIISGANQQADGAAIYPLTASVLRGFKYGLLNAVPTRPNAVFRYDTFGQFRDMLEPRPYARFWKGGQLAAEAPVQIVFMGRDGDVGVRPRTTNSQNLSPFATSSVPYDDGTARDRSTLEPDLDPDAQLSITIA